MNKFSKRLISLLLLASICGGGVSCSDKTPNDDAFVKNDESTSADDTTDEALKPELPDADYGGYEFTFFMRDGDYTEDMYAEELNGDNLNDAVFNRNRKVAEKYNVEFNLVRDVNDAGLGRSAKNSIIAGEDAYDVVIPHARFAFLTYAQDGLSLDWLTDLPYVDLDKPWWEADARESFTICGKLYAMIGDISYQNLAYTKGLFFNKRIFDDNGWEYPYQMVIDGDWTFDEMSKYALAAYRDLDGDSAYDIEKDQSGFATNWWGTPINILFTAGNRICDKDANGELKLCVNNERTVKVYEQFFSFMKNDGCYLLNEDDQTVIVDAFKDGRLLFSEKTLHSADKFRDMRDDFGIIPCPKFDSSMDEYKTIVDAGCNLLLVPMTAKDPERTSVILEALAYEGWKDVVPQYYDVVLGSKYTRDDESVKMLDIIRASRMYDTGYFCDVCAFSSLGKELCALPEPNFSSYYAQNESANIASIEKVNESYRNR